MKIKFFRRLLWLRPLQAAFLYSLIYALYFRHIRRFMPLPYQDYPKALTARFCPFYPYSTKGFLDFLRFFRHISRRYRLISYTPARSN